MSAAMRKSQSVGSIGSGIVPSPPGTTGLTAPDAAAAYARLDGVCRRSSYSAAHGETGENVFKTLKGGGRRHSTSSLPDVAGGRPMTPAGARSAVSAAKPMTPPGASSLGVRPLTPPPMMEREDAAPLRGAERPKQRSEVGPEGLTMVPMEMERPQRSHNWRAEMNSTTTRTSAAELEQRRVKTHYTTSYALQFPNYGEAAKPSMSTKTDFPAHFKTMSEQRALAQRQDAYWASISAARQTEELNKTGHLEKKHDLGMALTMKVKVPGSTMHHQYVLGSSSESWKSELRSNLDLRAHGSLMNEKYQQPARSCWLAKYKN